MARAKATTTDIHAKLARGECANFLNGSCQGRTACTIINGSPCDYFAQYVQPLLDYPEFAGKYGREAKIAVALNPRAKVVRKRQSALALDTASTDKPAPLRNRAMRSKTVAPAQSVPPPPRKPTAATVVGVDGSVRTSLPAAMPTVAAITRKSTPAPQEQIQLFLEITPEMPRAKLPKKRR